MNDETQAHALAKPPRLRLLRALARNLVIVALGALVAVLASYLLRNIGY